jgi:hypothetical protein
MGGGGGWRGKKNLMHNFPKQLGEGVPIWGSWGGWVGVGMLTLTPTSIGTVHVWTQIGKA